MKEERYDITDMKRAIKQAKQEVLDELFDTVWTTKIFISKSDLRKAIEKLKKKHLK